MMLWILQLFEKVEKEFFSSIVNTWSIIYPNNTSSFRCDCTSSHYGTYCEQTYDLCLNITCSGHGYCKVNGSSMSPHCSCYPYYFGDYCENMTMTLTVIKNVVTTSAVIAVSVLGGFYSMFILFDLSRLFQNFSNGKSFLSSTIN